MKTVLVSSHLSVEDLALLRRHARVVVHQGALREASEALDDAEGLVLGSRIDREIMEECGNLIVIGHEDPDSDDIDVEAASALGIPIVSLHPVLHRSSKPHPGMLNLLDVLAYKKSKDVVNPEAYDHPRWNIGR